MNDDPLFAPEFLDRVRRLRLRLSTGAHPGGDDSATGTKRGGFFEFYEHREYSPGDDPRFLDWNIAARSGRLFVKEFRREEEPALSLLIDRSASMRLGSPVKFDIARRLAAALALIALDGGASVRLGFLEEDACRIGDAMRGPTRAGRILRSLEAATASGAAGVAAALADVPRKVREPATIVVISDFLDARDARPEIVTLQRGGHQPVLFQVLDRSELHPTWRGPMRLVDSETGEERRIDFDGPALRRASGAVHDFLARWERFGKRHGIPYALVPTDVSLSAFLFKALRGRRILR